MFTNVIRFDNDEQGHVSPSPISTLESRSDGWPSVAAPDSSEQSLLAARQEPAELRWMADVIEGQSRILQTVKHDHAAAMAQIRCIGQTVCPSAWDEALRTGEKFEDWPSEKLADFIIQSVQSRLRSTVLAHDPQLPAMYQKVRTELAALLSEHHRLQGDHQRLRQELQVATKTTLRAEKKASERQVGPAQSDGAGRSRNTGFDAQQVLPQKADTGSEFNNTSEAVPNGLKALTQSGNERVDDVVRLIAETGICRWKDISACLAERWNLHPGSGATDTSMARAVSLGLLQAIEIRLEWGGKPVGKMLVLTTAGQQCAVALGVTPVESDYTRGLVLHKDGSHLYAILEVGHILSAFYLDVNCFPGVVATEDGPYHPDISAVVPNGNPIYVEVERGTYKGEHDRQPKWLRAALSNSGTVYLVATNLEAMSNIIAEINRVREAHPTIIQRIKAFNVRSYRDLKPDKLSALWAFET